MNPETDIGYMRMALSLAERGIGWTSPNPMVGAVVVRDGKAIAEGYHPRCGEAHAERIALEKAGGQAVGATLYVTLEPCAHHGKTPPCLDCVLASGVARVVIAMEDPNPLVHGKSIQALRDNGIEVAVGICEKEARVLNYPFLSSMLRQRPWVTLKYAMTLDGKIATSTGDSKWVSGEESRAGVQDIRKRHRAILVGFRTALTDDPLLTCRETGDPPPRQPLRIVLGGIGGLPPSSQLAATSTQFPTLHVLSGQRWQNPIREPGDVEGLLITTQGSILHELMKVLYEREIDSLLVEGGARTLSSFMEAGLVDEIYTFIAPKILNDFDALSPFPGEGGSGLMSDAIQLQRVSIQTYGQDVLVHGYLTEL